MSRYVPALLIFASPSLWSVLVVLVVVVGFGLLLRRALGPERHIRQRTQKDAEEPFKRWVQSVLFIVTRDTDYAYLNADEARRMLSEWWDILGPSEFKQTLEQLKKPAQSDSAWDLVRFMLLSRLGVAAGWISDDVSWTSMHPVVRRLRRAYPGWNAMAQAYVRARRQSQGLALDGTEDDITMRWVVDNVQRLRETTWTDIEFDADDDA